MAEATIPITVLAALFFALSAGFWVTLAWASASGELLQFYLVFLVFFGLWTFGVYATGQELLAGAVTVGPMLIAETGLVGTSVALFALSSVLSKTFSPNGRLAFLALALVVVLYSVLVYARLLPAAFEVSATDIRVTRESYVILFGPLMNIGLLFMLWAVRRRQRDTLWLVGAAVIASSQLVIVVQPSLVGFTLALMGAAVGLVLFGLGLLEREIVRPSRERGSQLEALRTVTSAITSLRPLEAVLDDLTRYAADLLSADMAGLFLVERDRLVLLTVRGLPRNYVKRELAFGEGMAGKAALTLRGTSVDDYATSWDGENDLPFARDMFGATVAEPLVYGGQTIGVVLAAMNRNGRVFSAQDRALLQLLAAQGAVALQQGRLLADQRALTVEVEAGRRQLESVLGSTESPVVALARDGHVLFANPSARSLAASAGLDLRRLFGPNVPPGLFPVNVLELGRALRRSGSYSYELALAGRSFICHVAPLGRPRPEGWVAVLNDVTELKALDRMKSDMMRMASHDLKNPLQAAMANLELLRDDAYDSGSQEVRESIDAVDLQLQRMYRIISGILDTDRAGNHMAPLAIQRPEHIIREVAEDMRLYARERGVQLQAECPPDLPNVRCDVEQFQRALGNLVENGLKYTPPGGEVTVSARQQGHDVLFEVRDTGVGIPVAIQPRVFERFFRGYQTGVEDATGTGLGLSLVKSIVEAHRGTVWFESEAGVGTQFYVRVPAAEEIQE